MAGSVLTVKDVLKGALASAHRVLETTVGDADNDLANRPAPGVANPIGTCYAHVIIAEDGIVNGLIQGKPPLMATTWAGRTGVDKAMPMPGMGGGDLGEWYHTAKVDLAACREYAKAVYANTEAFLDAADDATFSR